MQAPSMTNQRGASCVVTAWQKEVPIEQKKAALLALAPEPWSSLTYKVSSVSVTVGQPLPLIELEAPAAQGLLAPTVFHVACSAANRDDPSEVLQYHFDTLLSVGILEGHPVLEVAPDGSIAISPDTRLSGTFDAMSTTSASRTTIHLACKVWGGFVLTSIEPIVTDLTIEILDDVCWVEKASTFRSYDPEEGAAKPFVLTTSQVPVQNGAGHTYQLEDQVVTVTFKHDVVLGPETRSRYVRAGMPQDAQLRPDMTNTGFSTYDPEAPYTPGFICRWDSGNDNVIWFKYEAVRGSSYVWIEDLVTVTIPAGTTCKYPVATATPPRNQVTEVDCRATCRARGNCAFYSWTEGDGCKFHWQHEAGSGMTVVGKIPGCAAESTCMEVSGAAWHMSGLYCPAGTDVFRGVLYRKDGPTPEETLHLAKYHHNSDGALDGCSVGDWIFRKVDPTKDYIDTLSSGSSELHGEVLACSSGVRFVTVEGSCESRMNGEYIFQGLTQPGRPYYKQNGGSKWLFHDPKCKSGKSPRWIIGAVPPSTSRSSSLRSDGKGCTSFGYSDSDEALPREDGIWIMYCGERFKMDKGVSLEVSSTHISLAALPCSRPINLTDTDKDSALVFDDPGTEEAADYFLHPCDCIPDGWDGAPVSEEALDSVPSGSGNIFLPRPLALTTGDLVCPGEQLLVVHFQTQTESMESADCESRCKAWGPSQPCTFFWHGLQHGAMTCRLYGSCPYLVTEFGLEGQLVALPSEESCHVADPEACFASTLRRAYLDPTTSMASDSLEFRYKDLHLQCDLMLLLGGQIESCSRPTYRDPRSHEWAHKHQLPRSFAHGRRLEASCWHERYSAAWRSTTSSSSSKNTLICMNGQWLDSFSKPNLGDFGCHACLQIGFSGYKQVARKNMQELWFVGRHHMALFTEIASPGRSEINCLESRGSEFEPRKGRWVLGAKSQSCNSACQDEPGVGECMPEEMAKIDSAENFNAALQTLGLKCEPGGGPRDYAGVPFVDYAGRCYYWENPGVLPSCGDNAFNSPQEPLCYCRVRSCTATVRVESTSLGSGRSQVQSLERPGFCLEQTTRNDLAIPELRACNAGTPAQQIAMADLGAMVWRLYSIQHATSLDGASGGPEQSLSCVGSGAVGRIPMRQLFGWTGARVAVCHFAPVSEEISPFVTVEGSCRSVVNGKYIFQGLTQPGRPYYKREGSNTFLFHDPACEPGAAPSWRFTGFRPSTSKSSDLDGRGCSSTAFVVDDGALPPTGAVWRSSCNLEWVESQLTWTFAGTVDLGDTESWAARLADTPVACGLGQAITSMTVTGEAGSTQSLQYTCGRVSGLGVCTEQFPPQRHVEDWSIQSVLGPVVLECPADSLFSGFEFEFSEGGRWARFRYTCCQAAGAPVAVLNRGALRPREDTDGLYCPVAWDAGRLRYQKQVRSEGWILAPLHWSCDDTCGDAGLQCKPSKIALVNSGTQVEKVMKDIGIRCASTSTDSNSVPLLEPDGLACSFWSQTGNPTCQGVQFPDRQRPLCYCAQEPVPLQMLSFHLGEGRWCLGQDCVQVDLEDSLLPIGLSGNSWDAVAVQDLIGTGPAREEAKAKLTKPRSIKNPKRPTAPKQPDIEGFVPQQPLYSKECMDYGELWEKITETYTEISADAPETHENKLPTEAEDQPGKLDDHPCTVASKVTGVSGEAGGGDGSDVGPYLSYVDLDGCAARVINRGLKTALLELSQANLEKFFDTVQTGIDVATAVIPNMIAAPVGVGAEFEAGGAAKAAATAAKKVTKRISEAQAAKALTALAAAGGAAAGASNIASAGYSGGLFNIEEEDFNDCDPMQAEVDRLFCDIHCVRDAVIRGDRTIIRNLKAATDVTNGNMKKLAEWSVLSNRAETGWLAEKIDTTDERLSLQIQHLQDSVDGTTLLEAKQASGEMLLEIAGFAQAASFNVLSRATAKDALERFLAADAGDAGPSAATGSASSFQTNASRVASGVLQSLADLRGTLRSASGPGASRLAMLGAQFRRDAGRMHQLAKRQMQVLGMYRDHSNITRKKVQTWRQEVLLQEQHAALFTVDRIWWELRGKLDEYMETATVQVAALETSLATMASYEHCASSLHEVQQSYAASLVARDRGHSKLRAAWRESSRLLGELASVVVDGDVFQTFVKSEGCDSALAAQTMQQAKYAVGSMKLLLHRFEVGGLTLPDTSAVQDSAKRLQESFEKATAC
ncbi:unnamed protein product [Symbiodinium sp. CCMP2592]|nr:unnamed protein product [Symbiodinium sp. CCMP2592]